MIVEVFGHFCVGVANAEVVSWLCGKASVEQAIAFAALISVGCSALYQFHK